MQILGNVINVFPESDFVIVSKSSRSFGSFRSSIFNIEVIQCFLKFFEANLARGFLIHFGPHEVSDEPNSVYT